MIFWTIFMPAFVVATTLYFTWLPELHKRGPKGRHKIDRHGITRALPHEYGMTIVSVLLFAGAGALVGYGIAHNWTTTIASEPLSMHSFGIGLLGFLAAALLHDVYFYFTHRLLHFGPIFRTVHFVHHKSNDTNAWSAFSFHPVEGVIHVGIVPLIAFLLPMTETTLALFFVYMVIMTVYGHSGYELRAHRLWIFRFFNTSYHHYLHHRFVDCNYGIYLNIWDFMFGTNHKDYARSLDVLGKRIGDERNSAGVADDKPHG